MSEKMEEYENAEAVARNNDGILKGATQKLKMQPKSKQNTQKKWIHYKKRAYKKLMKLDEKKEQIKNENVDDLSEREKRKREGRLNAIEMKIKFIEIKENKKLYSRGRRPIKIAKGVFNKIKSFCSWVANKFRMHYINKNSKFMDDNLGSLSGMSDQINDYVEKGFSNAENSANKSEQSVKSNDSNNFALNENEYRMKKDEIIQDGVRTSQDQGVNFSEVNVDAIPDEYRMSKGEITQDGVETSQNVDVSPIVSETDQINIPDVEIEKDNKENEDSSIMEVPSLPEEFNNIFETNTSKDDEIVSNVVQEEQESEIELPISRTPVILEEKINNVEDKKEESILDSMTTDNGEIDYLATQRVLSEIEKKYDNTELLELSKQLAQALNENLMEKQNSGIIKEQRQVAEEAQQAVNKEYEESQNQLKNTMYSVLENVQSSTKQIEATNQEERAIVDSIKQDVEAKRQMTNANRTYISTVGEFNSYKSENVSEVSNSRGGK